MPTISKTSTDRHPAYQAWINMRYRCNNPTGRNSNYSDIRYDSSWESFEKFWEDVGDTWDTGLTIDRKDSTKGYYKENCRWVDIYVQANNKSSNRRLSLNGRTMNLRQWSQLLNVKETTIRQRIDAYGWSVKDALSKPVRQKVRI